MKRNYVVKKDEFLTFYIYQITLNNHKQLGFLALADINDYLSNKIKGHEKTYQKRMQDRADQMVNINAQIGPIYTTFPENINVTLALEFFTKYKPAYDFESFDKSRHKLWCINNKSDISKIIKILSSIKLLYIADGHHRMGAMNIISKSYLNNKTNANEFMVAAFPSNKVQIF